jgi:hypothetical protein
MVPTTAAALMGRGSRSVVLAALGTAARVSLRRQVGRVGLGPLLDGLIAIVPVPFQLFVIAMPLMLVVAQITAIMIQVVFVAGNLALVLGSCGSGRGAGQILAILLQVAFVLADVVFIATHIALVML